MERLIALEDHLTAPPTGDLTALRAHRPGTDTVTTLTPALLSAQERQVLHRLADGSPLPAVAALLTIREGAARNAYRRAREKLRTDDIASTIAAAYATALLTPPALRDRGGIFVLHEQRELIPLIAQGMNAPRMAAELRRSTHSIRCDTRDLLATFGARTRPHLIKQAWTYQFLTTRQVLTWLH